MKKFSDALAEDRDFEFMGELFKWKYVHWSVLTGIVDSGTPNGKKEPTATENVEEIIIAIPQFIDAENDGPSRMSKLLTDGPVPIGQVNSLYEYLLEVTSGRPTEQPSPSQAGPGKTAASSRGA